MPVSYVNVGTVANDGTGDPIRSAFVKVNDSLSGLYNYRTLASTTPTGNLTPLFVGEEIMTTVSGEAFWKAINTTTTGWRAITYTPYDTLREDYGTVP